ncbi:tRNA (adenosine(37)-N6)-threonylcarbamoyltransferase complex ATPase subunit type 1 TsaE [Streptococcus chenjunshii]|uniref:tRNA threonylcarbamoyladenosine biosynthesis protein TsaE n=1 Tax=Streptococcus chenjunshii TaxID=2173853 RepID=A0A372KLN2_9STRE|nr:tRNA (adenosine(37)-N6)-threonylcarbamoyltransferase complex ATPase subunit type 1 TsaE [Streptococcus chenjunshii]AXQ79467.1 tRNA (adenosine(37)-N6)-threonylcarbamoyltransferase complex ATPase subunit type 1 TsaE [Streptococcus chenjunshii]RFU51075.1 tRNA (adenosine(37)-N6)-threonylcarbamoyltransferase complex ATPase subunit type 1 TsaE [Streptococcus chenjunshii]RFU53173.1 tRNA (adenosine(37)-N6)-threonylcarbamoyltransferase complex ATPase subunit type 1 TsaE [Streptococcus chenjunshii]
MFYSRTEDELIAIGRQIGQKLQKGQVLVLTGELGAGKTTLTKGLALGLEVSQMVKSPTYTIVRQYQGRLPLYHLDVYRIGDDPDSIDLDDFLYGDGVTVIEWGELLADAVLDDYLEVLITKKETGRELDFVSHGDVSGRLLEEIRSDSKRITG